MKTFSPALAAHLASGATTLCTCWRVSRGDGIVLGFTDHDRAITFDGVDHEPESGLDASAAVSHAGLQVGGLDVTGAFASEKISEDDLEAGLFDNARVEAWLVNWAAPAERHLMRVGLDRRGAARGKRVHRRDPELEPCARPGARQDFSRDLRRRSRRRALHGESRKRRLDGERNGCRDRRLQPASRFACPARGQRVSSTRVF